MTHQEFDALAETILLSMVHGEASVFDGVEDVTYIADHAIQLADALVTKLSERRRARLGGIELLPEEIRALEDHRPIETIKMVRERTGMSLKEAKEIVDEARKKLDL